MLRNRVLAGGLLLAALTSLGVTAGCGSRLDPSQVAGASAGVQQGGAATGVAADGTAGGGTVVAGTDGGSTGAGTGSTGQDGGSTGGTTTSGAGTTSSDQGAAQTSNVKAGSCTGFENQTGISDDAITISNVSDISGPVPGLFQASQDAVKAFVAYFNATTPDGICGRKLNYLALDTREDAGGDQSAYAKSCDEAFAVIGSASAFDAGGAATAEKCGIPDIRSNTLSNERGVCSVCYPTQSGAPDVAPNAGFRFYRGFDKAATDRSAFLYIDVAGSADQSDYLRKVAETVGFKTVYKTGIDITEFNYSPYAQKLKDLDVGYVSLIADNASAVKLAKAMEQIGYTPKIFDATQEQYSQAYVESAGSAGDGTSVILPHPLFSEAGSHDELQLYTQWLQQVAPGADPTTTGLFSWSAARMFVREALALGGKLTRATMLDRVRAEHAWTANGLHTAEDVGGKRPGKCALVIKLFGTTWKQISPKGYTCGTIVQF